MAGNNKYVRNIREIVGIDVKQSKLGPASRKSNVNGSRGIAYKTPDGTGSISKTGSPGTQYQDPKDAYDTGSNYPTDSWSGNSGSTYSPTDNVYDAEDLIDGTGGLDIGDSVYNGIGDRFVYSGGTLSGLSGLTDCDSGKSLDLRFDGLATPPEGWDTPNEPSSEAYETWTQGIEYYDEDAPSVARATADLVASAQAIYPYLRDVVNPGPGVYAFWYASTPEGLGDFQYISVLARSCTVGDSSSCPLVFNRIHEADGVQQLLRQGGKFVSSPHEPEADRVTSYQDNQHSSIDACFGTGRKLRITPTASGGYLIGELDGDSNMTGVIRVFDSNNKLRAYTDYVSARGWIQDPNML